VGIDTNDRELALVADLCRELVKLGLQVGLSDARPAVIVRSHPHPLWVTVDDSGRFFEWTDVPIQHPVTDLPGAAALIHSHVTAVPESPGDLP
jgi:hypothetical protein